MIITCPECAARYDVDDDRFSPNGRSVRCTACGQSWYVPAPEALDMAPLDASPLDTSPAVRDHGESARDAAASNDFKPTPRPADKGACAEAGKKPAGASFSRSRAGGAWDGEAYDGTDLDAASVNAADWDDAAEVYGGDDEDWDDDALFEEPAASRAAVAAPRSGAAPRAFRRDRADRTQAPRDRDAGGKGWRQGKQFIVADDDLDPREAKHARARKARAGHALRDAANDAASDAASDARGEAGPGDRPESGGAAFRRRLRGRRESMREALRFSDADEESRFSDLGPSDSRASASGKNGARRRPDAPRGDAGRGDAGRAGAGRANAGRGDGRRYRRPDEDAYDRPHRDGSDAGRDGRAEGSREATIVDADFEDVDGAPDRGFGRRIRAERRRATAVARVEDVRPFSADYLDEEFFASLQVTPKELERALRKARRRAEARDKNRLTPWRAFGWTAWAAMVAGAVYAGLAYRDDIVRIAPQAADAYAVIGVETNPSSLAIGDVRHRLAMSTAGPTIEITGSLRNDTGANAAAPLLQAEALGARGELLSRWTFSASEAEIAPGDSISFVTRAPAPEGVAEVALSFAPARGGVRDLLTDNL